MRAVALVGLLLACSGPPASDGALCRDVAHRICISECGNAYNALGLQNVADCDAELQRRTGCTVDQPTDGGPAFAFQSRSNFLSCRLPILRAGDDVEQRPECIDIDDMFIGCPSMLQFYLGNAQP